MKRVNNNRPVMMKMWAIWDSHAMNVVELAVSRSIARQNARYYRNHDPNSPGRYTVQQIWMQEDSGP